MASHLENTHAVTFTDIDIFYWTFHFLVSNISVQCDLDIATYLVIAVILVLQVLLLDKFDKFEKKKCFCQSISLKY